MLGLKLNRVSKRGHRNHAAHLTCSGSTHTGQRRASDLFAAGTCSALSHRMAVTIFQQKIYQLSQRTVYDIMLKCTTLTFSRVFRELLAGVLRCLACILSFEYFVGICMAWCLYEMNILMLPVGHMPMTRTMAMKTTYIARGVHRKIFIS